MPAASRVAQSVNRGEVMTDHIVVADIPRIARYLPIVAADGKVLGAIGAGISRADAEASVADMRNSVLVALAILTLV
ncbi:cache domain-containing protein, partial [Acinetobacter baumannii]